LSRFLLTHLLINELKVSPSARMVNIAASNFPGSPDFDDLQAKKKRSAFTAHGNAQRSNDLFGIELAHRLTRSTVEVFVTNPGSVNTDIRNGMRGPFMRLMAMASRLMSISARESATRHMRIISSDEFKGKSGALLGWKMQVLKPRTWAVDVNNRKRLWDISTELTKPWLGDAQI
jgi:retinol dehydrogenase 12